MTTWTEIARLDSPTAGTFDFTSLTLSSYPVVQVVMAGITAAAGATIVSIRFYVGGSEISGTAYRWGLHADVTSGTGNTDGATGAAAGSLMSDDVGWRLGNAAGVGFGGIVTLDMTTSTALHKKGTVDVVYTNDAGSGTGNAGVMVMENAGAIDGIKISGTSNLTAGHVRILGIA